MWKHNLHLRVAGPTLLVSIVLLGLCIAVAAYLSHQQTSTELTYYENVASVQAAYDLETILHKLIAALRQKG